VVVASETMELVFPAAVQHPTMLCTGAGRAEPLRTAAGARNIR